MIHYRTRTDSGLVSVDSLSDIKHFALTRGDALEWISEQSAAGIQRRLYAGEMQDAALPERQPSDIEWIAGDDGKTIVSGRMAHGQYDIHIISVAAALNLLLTR